MTVSIDRRETGWLAVLAEMLSGVREALIRFPLPALFLLAAAIQANLAIAGVHFFGASGFDGERVFALLGAALAGLAVALFGEAHGHRAATRAVAGMFAGLGVWGIMAFPGFFDAYEWTFAVGIAGLVLVSPFLGRGDGSSFWMFGVRAAFAGLLGLLSLLLLAGGISAILASLTLLFGLSVPDELHQHVWATTGLFIAPLFALGQLTRDFGARPGEGTESLMDQGMRALGDFVAAPLLIVYAVILHLYVAKILVTGTVPEGQIGWLVMTYGFCVFGVLILINPFFDRARAPTRAFLRLWPFMLPIPVVLLFYALALRIGAFGLTPERVLLGLFGAVTVVLLVLQLLPRLRGDIRYVAALPIAALILGSFGPWGAVALSIGSQSERFLEIVGNAPVEGKRHEEALGALRFLSARDALARVAPEGAAAPERGWDYHSLAEAWDLDPDFRLLNGRHMSFNRHEPMAVSSAAYDTLIQNIGLFRAAQEPVTVRLPSGQVLAFALEENALVVTADDLQVRFPLSEVLARLDDVAPDQPLRFTLREGNREILFLPLNLYGDVEKDQRLESLNGDLLLRAQDWR